jgi:hypothetical protein
MWRNPVVASLVTTTVLLLIAITVSLLVDASRIAKARQKAEENRRKAEENLYAAEMHEAETALEKGDLGRARQLIEAHRPGPKGNRSARLSGVCFGGVLAATRLKLCADTPGVSGPVFSAPAVTC